MAQWLGASQMRAAGLSRRAQAAAVDGALLPLIEPRAAVVGSTADTWHRRLWAGHLALGRAWVDEPPRGCQLHGFDRFDGDDVDFTVLRDERALAPDSGRTLHTTSLRRRAARHRDDRWVARDLGNAHDHRSRCPGNVDIRLGAAIDSVVRIRLSAPIVIARRLAELRGPGRRGARFSTPCSSTPEVRASWSAASSACYAMPVFPVRERRSSVRANGRQVARVDFLFEDWGIVRRGVGTTRPRHVTRPDPQCAAAQ